MNMKKTDKNVGKMNKGLVALIVFTFIMIAWSIADSAIRTAHAEPQETTTETTVVMTTMTSETLTETTTSTTASTTSTTETDATTATTSTSTTTLPSQEEESVEEQVVENYEQPVVERQEEKVVTSVQTTTVQTTTTIPQTTITETEMEVTEEVETEEETEVFDSSTEEVYLGNFRITGYIADPGAKTASGTIPCSTRTIAMNQTQFKNLGLKYGDKIRVEGIGTFILEDCGCKSGRIDIFRDSEAACYALIPYADAYLVKE